MSPLQIYDRRERVLVSAGDAVLTAGASLARLIRRRSIPRDPRRILLLRLERIGDLLMVLPAIADLHRVMANAEIDIVVGSWNRELAISIRGLRDVHVLDASWLARGSTATGLSGLVTTISTIRRRKFDLAINFEPDIRSNLLLAASGAAWTIGYRSGGGGGILDQAVEYRPDLHTTDNARALIRTIVDDQPTTHALPVLDLPAAKLAAADELLARRGGPRVAVHVPGGRQIKQWEPEKFAAIAGALAQTRGATIVLTGGPEDRRLLDEVRRKVPTRHVVDASALDLMTVAAVLSRCDLLITGDTGPMHLAHAVGTPIVAVFGPSDPRRYAPRGPRDRVIRVDLPCAPCNRIRLPPARCSGRTPDCLALIGPERVLEAAGSILDECRGTWNASA